HRGAAGAAVRRGTALRAGRGCRGRAGHAHAPVERSGVTAPLRVLIVDDEPLARKLLRLLLEADPEVVVAGESSGVGGAAEVFRTRPDILFLDVQMPEVD